MACHLLDLATPLHNSRVILRVCVFVVIAARTCYEYPVNRECHLYMRTRLLYRALDQPGKSPCHHFPKFAYLHPDGVLVETGHVCQTSRGTPAGDISYHTMAVSIILVSNFIWQNGDDWARAARTPCELESSR